MLTVDHHDLARITNDSHSRCVFLRAIACSDEFCMADDAFALSPISARAARPGEADYEAIRDAFMETRRGRWFLGEYAKRNRNADTRLVLDQVVRIERMLDTLPQQPSDARLSEILATIRSVVDQAAEVAGSAAIGLEIDERLAPIRKGARILKEISWRWREIGTDSQICNSIDAQVDAIQESCRQLAKLDTHAALGAAFELMRTRIDALAEENGLAPLAPSADAAADLHGPAAEAPARSDETLASLATLAGTMTPEDAVVSIHEVDTTAAADQAVETADVWRNGEQALFGIPSNSDPAAVIRGMSLADKMTFFA